MILTINQIKINKEKEKIIKNNKTILKLKIPYPIKKYYKTIIPLNIFQTWHSKTIPKLTQNMAKVINLIKMNNPAFNYYLFDDTDCREFIKEHFEEDVLRAFDSLIPGAYKADLWRYCVLFIKGGIYLDIKYKPLNKFKFINLTEKEHWCLDIGGYKIYNAIMCCLPGNSILFKSIRQIVENVKNKFYGSSCLDPTGPGLLAKFFSQENKRSIDMNHTFYENLNNRLIHFNGYTIFKSYNNYIIDNNKSSITKHYSCLWAQKKIYKN